MTNAQPGLAADVRYVSRDSNKNELYVARTNHRGVYSVALFRMTKIYPDTKKNNSYEHHGT